MYYLWCITLGKKGNERKAQSCGEKKVMVVWGRDGMDLKMKRGNWKLEELIKLKWFLHTDFTTKNYFRALDVWLGYKFHHLTKTKTNLKTTLISQIRDKQVESLSNNTEEFQTQLQISNIHHWVQRNGNPIYNGMPKDFLYSLGNH